MQHKKSCVRLRDPQGVHQSVEISLQHAQKSLEQQCSIGAAYTNAGIAGLTQCDTNTRLRTFEINEQKAITTAHK